MSETSSPWERINLRLADDTRDVVHRAVAALAQGGTILFQSESFTGPVRGLWWETAFSPIESSEEAATWTLMIRGHRELVDWIPNLNDFAQRLVRKAWPAPLTLVFPVPGGKSLVSKLPDSTWVKLLGEDGLGVEVPDHPFLREVAKLVPGPVGFRELTASEGALTSGAIDETLKSLPSGATLVIEDFREEAVPKRRTIARVDEHECAILQKGYVTRAMLNRISCTTILFVCTGNTCRSPMAEALCKILVAKRLGCEIDALEGRGYLILSAGVAAMKGMPAAANAVEVARLRGGSLESHLSRGITGGLIHEADHILAMTADHLEVLLDRAPEAAPRARLLHPRGEDVPDPVGMDLNVYKRTADAIESYLNPWLDSIGLGSPR